MAKKELCFQMIEDISDLSTISGNNLDLLALCRKSIQNYTFADQFRKVTLFDPKVRNDVKTFNIYINVKNMLYLPFNDKIHQVITPNDALIWIVHLPKYLEEDFLKIMDIKTPYELVEKQMILIFF
ncbi:hypothetical protein DLEV_152 [Diachasmimorpha longicaudata entomopoxvirus]|uniref:Uncharacterized protein n=1 Tax=Diachasmimorpha longicaudata entomopoxvirus TaxID=109981 RepID=A0A7R5WJG0_9POXV|nr:hypothetical protein QKK69_gp152 [Diachasmimorpha longicaudata entomopoxvirus]AKS26443.1 hypothetical protein DLEV_152 [Diachasmimorpha longicaudata entomopoxvirus]